MRSPRRFLPSTASLRALETFDRLGSTVAAAQALALTQSAVSRQLQTLEAQLGVPLFLREGRRMVLTPEGADYAAEIRGALHTITQASLKLTLNPEGGSLNLAILPTFGMRWLVPRLPEFARTCPEVTINLSTRLHPFNFGTEPFDAAIHFGLSDWPETQALYLRSETVVPVCSPDYLRQNPIQSAGDLLSLSLLHIETRPEAWSAWFEAQGVETKRVKGTVYDQFSTITQAALHGLGIALLPDYLARQDIASGRLCVAWGHPTPSPGGYYLVWPREKARNPALAKFRDWLKTQTGDEDLLPR